MMNSQELETAVRLELNLVVLIVRDDGYGMIRWKQGAMGLPQLRPGVQQPRLREVRRSVRRARRAHRQSRKSSCPTCRARSPRAASTSSDVPIDYSENRIFTRELEQLQALSPDS